MGAYSWPLKRIENENTVAQSGLICWSTVLLNDLTSKYLDRLWLFNRITRAFNYLVVTADLP